MGGMHDEHMTDQQRGDDRLEEALFAEPSLGGLGPILEHHSQHLARVAG